MKLMNLSQLTLKKELKKITQIKKNKKLEQFLIILFIIIFIMKNFNISNQEIQLIIAKKKIFLYQLNLLQENKKH